MELKILTLTLIAFVARSSGNTWDGLTASWSANQTTHFYPIPLTYKAAVEERWTKISGVNPPKGITALGYCGDPTFVLLARKNCDVIGFQIGFPVADVAYSGQPMNFDKSPAITQKKLNGVPHYTTTILFSNDKSNDCRRLWVEYGNGFMEIPTNASQIPLKTDYMLKRCAPSMGTHYYAINATTDCAGIPPHFFLAEKGNVVGVGFQAFGPAIKRGKRIWWEDIQTAGVKFIIPDAPKCLIDAKDKFGVYSLHVWFLADAKKITCG